MGNIADLDHSTIVGIWQKKCDTPMYSKKPLKRKSTVTQNRQVHKVKILYDCDVEALRP